MRVIIKVVALSFVATGVLSGSAQDTAHSVDTVLQSFRLADDRLTVEPAAAEPNIIDPVSVTWDEDGRMYVVEMRDYPGGAGGGSVRRLVDADHDGVYESATLFAEGLPYPTSAVVWKGGVIVAAAPDLVYLKDTNGDGVADERRALLTGFGQGLPQTQVNSLYWGADLWVYASNGGAGGNVTAVGGPGGPVSIAQCDFRFRPGVFEAVTGFSANGSCQTWQGDRLVSRPESPFRLALAAADSGDVSILDRYDSGRIWPIAPAQQRFGTGPLDQFNASCGLAYYDGGALEGYAENVFTCEPASNLVHRRVLTPHGSMLTAVRGESGFEFLASSDPWFRPVGVATGPDGALYIVDFCRERIEHPSAAPEDVRATIDWRAGSSLGRIWRVRPKNWDEANYAVPALSGAAPEEWVKQIESGNGWTRRQAQRLLADGASSDSAAALATMAASSERPEARVAALMTLDAMGACSSEVLAAAFASNDARVRAAAVDTAAHTVAQDATLAGAVAALAQDPDIVVRRHVAAAAAAMPGEQRLATCRALIEQGETDAALCAAVLRAAGSDAWPLLDSVFAARTWDLDWWVARNFEFAAQLADRVGGSGQAADVAALLHRVASSQPVTGAPDVAFLAGLGAGMARNGQSLKQLLAQPPADLDAATVTSLERAFASADLLAHHKDAAVPLRGAAVRLLLERPDGSGMDNLLAMLKPDERPEVVNAIVNALGQSGGDETNQALLDRWAGLSKDVRTQLVRQFVTAPPQTAMLLDAIDGGVVLKHEIELPVREQLLASADSAIQARAAALYPQFTAQAKADLFASYAPALQSPANAASGAKHFAANCFPCHRIQGVGNTVGPDLTASGSKPKELLLRSVLDPSAEVLPEYISFTISTKNFEDYAGLMVKEDAGSVTLRGAGGMENTVQRADIETMSPGATSLMPEGLEAALDHQALADLVEFIQHPDMDALKKAVAEAAPPAL